MRLRVGSANSQKIATAKCLADFYDWEKCQNVSSILFAAFGSLGLVAIVYIFSNLAYQLKLCIKDVPWIAMAKRVAD